MDHWWMIAIGSLALAMAAACGEGGGDSVDAGDTDAESADADVTDADTTDADTTDGRQSEFGFEIRTPAEHDVTCSYYPPEYPEEPEEFADSDWLCTFEHGETHAHVYVQSTPVDCEWAMFFAYPVFETHLGQVAIAGDVTDLSYAAYDWGGNHHNDTLTIDLGGKRYVYDHSSYGVGWHACQPMDCLRVFEGTTLVEDGCTEERTLPIVCVQIEEDGTHDTLEDRFEPCR